MLSDSVSSCSSLISYNRLYNFFCPADGSAIRTEQYAGRRHRPHGLAKAAAAETSPRISIPYGRRYYPQRRGNSLIIRVAGEKTAADASGPTLYPNGSNGNSTVDFLRPLFGNKKKFRYLCTHNGGLAQLARALAWHARGHQFDPGILHNPGKDGHKSILIFLSESVPCIHKCPPLSSCSDRAQTGRGTIRIRTKPRAGSARAKKTAIGRKKHNHQ